MIPAQGLAFAVGSSVMLRTLNYTIDISLTTEYSWIGWGLALILGVILVQFKWHNDTESPKRVEGVTSAAVGVMSILTLFYFMLSSPGVMARWTEGNYQLIIIAVSGLTLLWLFISLLKPAWILAIKRSGLLIWNLLFLVVVVWMILAHTFPFPVSPAAAPVVVTSPTWYQQIPLLLTLLLFPVVFFDFGIFAGLIAHAHPTPRKMAPGFILGVLFLVLLVFMNIFSNTWGYVEPISPFFRNKFWLPFLLLLGLISALQAINQERFQQQPAGEGKKLVVPAGMVLGIIFLATIVAALLTDRTQESSGDKNSLKVMTYNIQQANDVYGEKSYQEQLALIKQVDPDIIGFQESDSTRVSLGNNDYIRYYANKLGYYSYFGPTTVTGTYGTAILSKYPLLDPRSVFTYSDQDEIGTAEVEISLAGKKFTIFNVHPAGSDEAKMVFATTLVQRAAESQDVIAIGDYNLRGWEDPYILIDEALKNAWMDVYPTGIDDDGLDMSGENRIDHIFVSPHLNVSDPIYILPPDSWTDHPVHWAQISW
jgi:endonuclease/exonuclease/phosphatase family metal-dependent hydrolase